MASKHYYVRSPGKLLQVRWSPQQPWCLISALYQATARESDAIATARRGVRSLRLQNEPADLHEHLFIYRQKNGVDGVGIIRKQAQS